VQAVEKYLPEEFYGKVVNRVCRTPAAPIAFLAGDGFTQSSLRNGHCKQPCRIGVKCCATCTHSTCINGSAHFLTRVSAGKQDGVLHPRGESTNVFGRCAVDSSGEEDENARRPYDDFSVRTNQGRTVTYAISGKVSKLLRHT
jgi:hypothetical protein